MVSPKRHILHILGITVTCCSMGSVSHCNILLAETSNGPCALNLGHLSVHSISSFGDVFFSDNGLVANFSDGAKSSLLIQGIICSVQSLPHLLLGDWEIERTIGNILVVIPFTLG